MRKSLNSYCSLINGGAWSDEEYVETGIRVLRVSNMVGGTIISKDDKFLPESSARIYDKHRLHNRDTVIATVGSHPSQPGSVVGRTARVPQDWNGSYLNQNAACFRIFETNEVDPDYFWHLTKTILFKHHIESRARGTANQVRMAIGELNKLELDFPKIQVQRKIAAILTAYDDLIETNKRRIALLEKIAEAIYREWFVRLRFPDHQKTKIVRGIPEKWEVRYLRDCADINPSSLGKNDRPDLIYYVDIGSVTTNRIEDVQSIPLSEAPGRARRCVRHGDIIWSSVRPANRAYCLIYEPAEHTIVSTGFAVIRPRPEMPFTFLNFAVTSNGFVDQMAAVAKGAAYPATSFDDFEKAKLLWPGADLLQAFHNICEPIFRQKHTLTQQARVLTKTRDILLPRLISGKLSVADLDIQFPPSMCNDIDVQDRKE